MAAIELNGVNKLFSDVVAVRNIDLTVEEGEIFGFLGPNGAGKSTTINLLLDFVRPTSGSISVLGFDANENSVDIRKHTGLLPEGFGLYDRLTGRQHIEFAIDSKESSDSPETILERVGLTDAADRKTNGYSTGMKQRLALGIALTGDPDLLILDEPSTGLDPNGAREMREIVREENDRGATIFFSSHILGQVEAVCDRVGILRDGELVAEDSVAGLREAIGTEGTLRITVDQLAADSIDEIRAVAGVTDVTSEQNTLAVTCRDDAKTTVLSEIESLGMSITDFETEEVSLEELFATYTTEEEQ